MDFWCETGPRKWCGTGEKFKLSGLESIAFWLYHLCGLRSSEALWNERAPVWLRSTLDFYLTDFPELSSLSPLYALQTAAYKCKTQLNRWLGNEVISRENVALAIFIVPSPSSQFWRWALCRIEPVTMSLGQDVVRIIYITIVYFPPKLYGIFHKFFFANKKIFKKCNSRKKWLLLGSSQKLPKCPTLFSWNGNPKCLGWGVTGTVTLWSSNQLAQRRLPYPFDQFCDAAFLRVFSPKKSWLDKIEGNSKLYGYFLINKTLVWLLNHF